MHDDGRLQSILDTIASMLCQGKRFSVLPATSSELVCVV